MKTSTILLTLCALAVTLAWGAISDEMEEARFERCIAAISANQEGLEKLWADEDAGVDDKMECFHAYYRKALGVAALLNTVQWVQKNLLHVMDPIVMRFLQKWKHGPMGESNGCETVHAISICAPKNRVREDF